MTRVTATMRKKKPMAGSVGLPRLVSTAGAAAGAAWPRRKFRIASVRSMWISLRRRGERALVLQLVLEPLDLGVVGLVGPGHVDGGEHERDDDRGDAQRDGDGGGAVTQLLIDEVLRRRHHDDVAVVGDEEQGEEREAHRPTLGDEGLEVGRLKELLRRVLAALLGTNRCIRHVLPPCRGRRDVGAGARAVLSWSPPRNLRRRTVTLFSSVVLRKSGGCLTRVFAWREALNAKCCALTRRRMVARQENRHWSHVAHLMRARFVRARSVVCGEVTHGAPRTTSILARQRIDHAARAAAEGCADACGDCRCASSRQRGWGAGRSGYGAEGGVARAVGVLFRTQ